MARPVQDVEALRRAFVVDRLPLEKAAEKAVIPYSTARKMKWRAGVKGDDWDRARTLSAMTQAGTGPIAQMALTDFLLVHQETMEQIKSDQNIPPLDKARAIAMLTDAYSKHIAAAAKAAPDLGRYAVAMEVMTDFAQFVQTRYSQHAAALVEVLEPFAAALADKYG